jgi:clan AA aspartic protease
MISGTVTQVLEATVGLVVLGAAGQQEPIETVLDTGFSGFLTLPAAVIAALGLTWLGREQGILADGSTELFDVYRAAVMWEGQPRPVEVEATEAAPLLGMALLKGHEVTIQVVHGGGVTISVLP